MEKNGDNRALSPFGALEGTRTPDPLLRRQLLYPPELQTRERSFDLVKYNTKYIKKQQVFFDFFVKYCSHPCFSYISVLRKYVGYRFFGLISR